MLGNLGRFSPDGDGPKGPTGTTGAPGGV
jgi:hypothetical protein